MKKLLLLIFISISFRLFPQINVYHPFPDSNAVWKSFCGSSPTSELQLQHHITGADTTIGVYTYKKVFDGLNYVGAYRQDIPNKKVYAITPNLSWSYPHPINTEYLLCDFSLAIGDTFSARRLADCDTISIVTSIDSIHVDVQYRKKINLVSGPFSSHVSFIEGIGSSMGLFEWSCFEIGCGLCRYDDDSISFVYGSHDCSVGINEIDNKFKIEISPNPSSGIFTINSSEKFQFSVYDVFGREVLQSKILNQSSTLDLSAYPKGIYFVRLKSGDPSTSLRVTTKKIILQ